MKRVMFLSVLAVIMSSLISVHIAFAEDNEVEKRAVELPEINRTMDEVQDEAIFKMNEYRSKLGVPLLSKHLLLQRASQSHANYMFLNNKLGHEQYENDLGFTGMDPWNRAQYFGYQYSRYAEGITYSAVTAIDGINELFDAPYHRIPILNPQYLDVGTGYNPRAHMVVNYANAKAPYISEENEVVVYPYPDQKDAKTSWLALENPNPLRFWGISNSAPKRVGYPISYNYFGKGELVVEKVILKDSTGKTIPSYDVTPELEPRRNLLFIIPKEELEIGQTYDVAVEAYVDNNGSIRDVSKEWSFTTLEKVTVTNVKFTVFGDENELDVEINNGQNINRSMKLEKDGKTYLSVENYRHTFNYPIIEGDYTLTIEIPTLLKELKLPVTIQRNQDKFYNNASDWKVNFDRQGNDTEIINWLFLDVKEGMGHYEGIKYMVENNIVNGYDGYFSPWNSAHRGHVSKMIVNALDLELVSGAEMESILSVYADVTKDDSYATYIATATKAGIFKGSAIQGSNKRNFGTYQYTNREQMATVLVRAFGLNSLEADDVAMNLSNVSKDHQPNVQVLANLGITDQLDDFGPRKQITRAALSTFLYRVMTMDIEG